MRFEQSNKSWFCLDLPVIDYKQVWSLQHEIVKAKNTNQLDKDVALILEHSPVFTLGRRGGKENLFVSNSFLEQKNISVVQIERGGNITFHGPGQIIVYLIVDLHRARIRVVDFVHLLEEMMIRTARKWNIKATRNSLNPGVWVNDRKIGSVGITIRKGVSFHGIALNVNNSLEPFEWIKPCGLENISITSMQNELGNNFNIDDVRNSLKQNIEFLFNIELVDCNIAHNFIQKR